MIFIITTNNAVAMYRIAMIGTMISDAFATRLIPPNMIIPRRTATTAPV